MSPENSDRAALCNARLIASMATLRGGRSSEKSSPGLCTPLNDPSVNGNQIDGTPLHSNLPH